MVGYGPEDNHFVVELTYNYGLKSYKQGNDYQVHCHADTISELCGPTSFVVCGCGLCSSHCRVWLCTPVPVLLK